MNRILSVLVLGFYLLPVCSMSLYGMNINQAIIRGNAARVQQIINSNMAPININQQNLAGQTLLHLAVRLGTPEVVNELIDAGADIDAQDAAGIAPLHLAAQRGDFDIINELIDAGANVNVRTNLGLTPSDFAQASDDIAVSEVLRQAGAVH